MPGVSRTLSRCARRSSPASPAAAIVIVAVTSTLTRGPGFHEYADQRVWLGIPHAGDVLSNVAFLIVCARGLRDAYVSLGRLVCLGVGFIGIGSGLYHVAPSDTRLAFDWAPIAVRSGAAVGAVIRDRGGHGGIARRWSRSHRRGLRRVVDSSPAAPRAATWRRTSRADRRPRPCRLVAVVARGDVAWAGCSRASRASRSRACSRRTTARCSMRSGSAGQFKHIAAAQARRVPCVL